MRRKIHKSRFRERERVDVKDRRERGRVDVKDDRVCCEDEEEKIVLHEFEAE